MIQAVLWPTPAKIGKVADSSKNNMSDWTKYALNLARQFEVGTDRRLDYGMRGMSMPLNSFMKFATFYYVRDHLISPQVESILELDKLHQQPHLTEQQRRNLPRQESILASDFDMLKVRLMDRNYAAKGLSFHTIPKNLQLDGRLVEKFVDGRYIYDYEPISAQDPLIDHLYYRLDFRHYLRNVVESYHTLGKRLPYFPQASYDETVAVADQLKSGLKHLEDTKMTPFMSEARWFLLDLGNGRYRYKQPSLGLTYSGDLKQPKQPVKVHQTEIMRTFDRYLNPRWSEMPVEQRFISHIIDQFIEGPNVASSDERNSSMKGIGKDDKLTRQIKKDFKRRLVEETPASTPLAERLEHLFNILQSEYADIKTPDAEALRFNFDKKNQLGLKGQPVAEVAQQLATRITAISDVFRDGQEQARAITDHEAMKALGKSLVTRFDAAYLKLIATFPVQGKPADALRKIAAQEVTSPLFRQFQDGLKSDTNVRSLSSVLSNSKLPDLVLGVVPSIFLSGIVWSWLDNKVIQPYQRDIVARKGDSRGATPALMLGLGVGWATFFKTKRLESVRMLLGNNDASLFRLSGMAGLALGTLATLTAVRGVYALKPDIGNDGQPIRLGWRQNLARARKEFFNFSPASLMTMIAQALAKPTKSQTPVKSSLGQSTNKVIGASHTSLPRQQQNPTELTSQLPKSRNQFLLNPSVTTTSKSGQDKHFKETPQSKPPLSPQMLDALSYITLRATGDLPTG